MGRRSRFTNILIKNTLAIAIPIAIFFFVLAAVLLRYPLNETIKCKNVDKHSQISDFYDSEFYNVKIKLNNLEYSGFDYLEDGKIVGAYYYMVTGDAISFYLLKTNNPPEHIGNKEINGRIIYDEVAVTHIINQFAMVTNLDYNLISNFTSFYIVSEIDYPYYSIILTYAMYILPIVFFIVGVLFLLYIFIFPEKHPCLKSIWLGKTKYLIRELNRQIANDLIFNKKNVYITKDYLVIKYIARVDVIKLDDIKYLTKHIEFRRSFLLRPIKVYKLTASNPENLYYQCEFFDEKFLDEAIIYLRGVNEQTED